VLNATLEQIRRDGVAFTRPPRPTRIHGMAVAILGVDRVLGSLSMRFPRSAMSEDVVGQRFGRRLAAVARAIAADIAKTAAGTS
jgi:IclR family mhp operon transcriptional activator